ncbi:MAG: hypothetical protein JWM80_3229 [Cyanobacteria bacterium RYN_339]|nr:hypothetical protein [Cyanobacteria bacterium RYN_339]
MRARHEHEECVETVVVRRRRSWFYDMLEWLWFLEVLSDLGSLLVSVLSIFG